MARTLCVPLSILSTYSANACSVILALIISSPLQHWARYKTADRYLNNAVAPLPNAGHPMLNEADTVHAPAPAQLSHPAPAINQGVCDVITNHPNESPTHARRQKLTQPSKSV